MTGINTDYSRFYKGMEPISHYGSGSGQKTSLVKYEFNTTDEQGNKVMDKMSREETLRTMKEISSQYGDEVIVEFSGDGLAALANRSMVKDLPEEHKEIPEGMITYLEGTKQLTEEELKSVPNARSGEEILKDMKEADPDAYEKFEAIRAKTKREGFDPNNNEALFLLKWDMKRQYPWLKIPNNEKSAKESAVKNTPVMTDYSHELAGRMPSVYGEKDENGEYVRNYFSVSDTASNLLKAYAGLYDEIVKGYEAGTRETYVEDKTAEGGYRKLTMDEELKELDKAYKDYADRYAANRDSHVLDILSAHAKKVSEISGDRAGIAKEANELLEKYKKDSVPKDFSDVMTRAADSFIKQYQQNKGVDINALLQGITVF
ncbi:MAG: hypothetical protein IJT16_08560 [Lachnospiraceae bacterium]|nr:hypothetical protein [Lachnospiraceae bacterium]